MARSKRSTTGILETGQAGITIPSTLRLNESYLANLGLTEWHGWDPFNSESSAISTEPGSHFSGLQNRFVIRWDYGEHDAHWRELNTPVWLLALFYFELDKAAEVHAEVLARLATHQMRSSLNHQVVLRGDAH